MTIRTTKRLPSAKAIIALLLTLSYACVPTEKAQRAVKISAQAGVHHGGIIENTDYSVVLEKHPEHPAVDVYSGATRLGTNVGVHVNKPLKYGELETGVDYLYNKQNFTYSGNLYSGERNFSVNRIMLPLTYNFCLFKRTLAANELQLKIGFLGQANLVSVSDKGLLPDYKLYGWSQGATLGLSVYVYRFPNGSKLGLFGDFYRGSIMYSDYYNESGFEMPGSSYAKLGIRYRFK